jgi:hypothetical protein
MGLFKRFARLRSGLRQLSSIADQLERANNLAELTLQLEHPAAYKNFKTRGNRPSRVSEISVASIADWNTEYHKTHPVIDDDDLG